MEFAPADARVAEFSLAAAEYVRRATGLTLDGSVESLAFVDHYVREAGDVSDETIALVAPALGAYFGEVVIARLGGAWKLATEPADWVVEVDVGGEPLLSFHPVGMAAEALRRGDVEGQDASIATPPELQAPLAEAMEAISPVEEDYYYSLTGRLETIEHVVDLLVAIKQRGK